MDNLVYAASATNPDTGYPAANVYDEHPQKVCKSLTVAGTLKNTITVTSYGDCNSLCLVNTNATQVEVTIKDTTEATTIWGPYTYDLSGIDTIMPLMHDIKVRYKDLWIDYPHQSTAIKIILKLYLAYTTDTIVYCGVVVNGLRQEMVNPVYGMSESLIDTSVIKWTSNKSLYYRKRDVIRKYSGSVYLDRDTELYFFLRYIAMRKGPAPMAWALTSDDNQIWIVYGTMADNMPSASHDYYTKSVMSFSVQEVI